MIMEPGSWIAAGVPVLGCARRSGLTLSLNGASYDLILDATTAIA